MKANLLNLESVLGEKVFVYFNLHTRLWSVRSMKTGLVLGHTATIALVECQLKVSKKGRERVLKEKKKNVHAGIVGFVAIVQDKPDGLERFYEEITYNPYKFESFVDKALQTNVHFASRVYMENKRVFAQNARKFA